MVFEKADIFREETAELAEESVDKGVLGRDSNTEGLRRKVSDISELPHGRRKENYSLRNSRRQKRIEEMGMRSAVSGLMRARRMCATRDLYAMSVSPWHLFTAARLVLCV